MNVRIRFKYPQNPIRMVKGRDLAPHEQNWRLHPDSQKNAMRGVLADIGFADVVKGIELEDGRIKTLDGHLRAEIMPDQDIPVLILDLDEGEAKKLLLTYDALGAMAEVDASNLDSLMADVQFASAAVNSMLADLAKRPGAVGDGAAGGEGGGENGPTAGGEPLRANWGLLVNCDDEQDQVRAIGLLQDNGYGDKFRALVG